MPATAFTWFCLFARRVSRTELGNIPLADAEHQRFISDQRNDAGWGRGYGFTINDQINPVADPFLNFKSFSQIAFLFQICACREYRVAEGVDNLLADSVIRNPDAHCFLSGQHDLRDYFHGRQDKGVWSGQTFLHQAIRGIGKKAVLAHVLQAAADETEGLVLIAFLELEDSFYRLLIEDVAADAIHGVSRIGNDGALLEGGDNLVNESLLRIDGIDSYNSHVFSSIGPVKYPRLFL